MHIGTLGSYVALWLPTPYPDVENLHQIAGQYDIHLFLTESIVCIKIDLSIESDI